jgi:hypothetical protein
MESVRTSNILANFAEMFPFSCEILLETMTLEFYHIQNGDSIIVLPETISSQSGVLQTWILMSRDFEAFDERIRSILNRGTAKEAARLRDLRFTALESRPKQYHKFCSNFLQDYPIGRPIQTRVVIPERPTAPSVEALPVLWNGPRPFSPQPFSMSHQIQNQPQSE